LLIVEPSASAGADCETVGILRDGWSWRHDRPLCTSERGNAMGALVVVLVWAFTGKAEDFASRLVQWWLRISAIWIALLVPVLVVLCAATAVVIDPQGSNVLMAYGAGKISESCHSLLESNGTRSA
jgi:hypothetical protein